MTETSMPRVVTTIADFRTAITESLAAAQEELDRAARQEAEQNGTAVQYTNASLGYVPTMAPCTTATQPCCVAPLNRMM